MSSSRGKAVPSTLDYKVVLGRGRHEPLKPDPPLPVFSTRGRCGEGCRSSSSSSPDLSKQPSWGPSCHRAGGQVPKEARKVFTEELKDRSGFKGQVGSETTEERQSLPNRAALVKARELR